MKPTVRATWLVVAVIALGMVGCATTGGNLASSAERLERSSYALERDASYNERPGFQSDARALAEEARDFRRTLDDRRASNNDLRDAFRDLSGRYHALRDEVERSQNRETDRDFQPVTEAYLDIEREMERHHDRYARD
ncbi:MAG TPA: hypothetical protein VGN07_02980 [Steroidobacteraceae bacterium]|jgi:hypothetical protein